MLLALLSNVGNAARNVAMKGCIARGHDISSHVTLGVQSVVSLVVLLAVFVPLRIVGGAWDADQAGAGGAGGKSSDGGAAGGREGGGGGEGEGGGGLSSRAVRYMHTRVCST